MAHEVLVELEDGILTRYPVESDKMNTGIESTAQLIQRLLRSDLQTRLTREQAAAVSAWLKANPLRLSVAQREMRAAGESEHLRQRKHLEAILNFNQQVGITANQTTGRRVESPSPQSSEWRYDSTLTTVEKLRRCKQWESILDALVSNDASRIDSDAWSELTAYITALAEEHWLDSSAIARLDYYPCEIWEESFVPEARSVVGALVAKLRAENSNRLSPGSATTRKSREASTGRREMKKKHVFLSYCRDNKDEVSKLRDDLITAGEQVWWDQDILGGQDWKWEIRRAMKDAYAVVFCLSDETADRITSGVYPEVLDAITAYRQHAPGNVFLIPVRLSECEIPLIEIDDTRTLDRLNYIDLFEPDGLQKLMQSIRTSSLHP